MQIMAGDLLRISIFGSTPPFAADARVSLDGRVHLPLAGTLKMEGLSLADAEQTLATRMEELEMYRNPQVSIQLIEGPGHIVTLIGPAHGVVQVVGHKRLFDILSAGAGGSGGLPITASPLITIDRPGVPDPIVIDLGSDPARSSAANIPVFAGDTITTGDVGSYYVVGAVKTPGILRLNGTLPTTAMQAIAASGGVLYISKANHAKLIRTVVAQRSLVEIQLRKVLDGKAPDPILQADDILFVPTDRVKQFFTAGPFTNLLGLALTAIAVTRY